jgi:UDP-N-acetylglucosamine 2-epimerase
VRKKQSSNNKKGTNKIVERIVQLDTKHKSMKCNLQAGNKQNKEEPNNDSFEKTRRVTHVQPQRNGEGYVKLPHSQRWPN